jgi:hypothetical protein
MWVFALPFFIEMETILRVWLKEPPDYSILFTRLALVEVLIHSISLPLATAARAPGRMKVYELTLGSIQITIFVVSWIVLKLGAEAYSVFIVAIVANFLMFIVRLIIVSKLIHLPVELFFKKVVLPVLGVILFSVVPSIGIHYSMPEGLFFTGITVFISLFISTLSMYYIGLDKIWREKIRNIIINKFHHFIK